MVSDAVRVFVGILVLSGLVVGTTWMVAESNEVVPPDVRAETDTTGFTLVEFPTQVVELPTAVKDIPDDGEVRFDLQVPFRNVTSLAVVLRVAIDGPSSNDRFEIQVVAPDEEVKTGTYTGPPTALQGISFSPSIIEGWARAVQPAKQRYETTDQKEALHRAAENHTRTGSTGTWAATITMNPPPVGLREANVSLLYAFTYYEAVAFPEPKTTKASATPGAATNESVGAPRGAGPASVSMPRLYHSAADPAIARSADYPIRS